MEHPDETTSLQGSWLSSHQNTLKQCVKRKNSYSKLSLFLISVLVLSLVLPNMQQVDGANNLKKAAKSFAKSLILSKLTSSKNFLPLPIPGKWQQVVNLMADQGSGPLAAVAAVAANKGAGTKSTGFSRKYQPGSGSVQTDTSSAKEKKHLFKASMLFSGNDESAGKKLLLFGASNLVDSLASLDSATGGKLGSLSKLVGSSGKPSTVSASSAIDMQNVKKLTRLAAAKYAKRIISNEATANSKTRPSGKTPQITKRSMGASKRNDYLVTAFNVVKLAKQIRELSPQKLLQLKKKSALPATSSAMTPRLPILSIDNRKTLISKLHFIHWLTSELHHRHRYNKSIFTRFQ